MKIDPKNGLANLLFGMKTTDVVAQLGTPNRHFQDEDGNTIYLYDSHKLRLTFYADEDFRLGYAITSSPDALLLGHTIVGAAITELLEVLPFSSWETEDFDSVTNYFNESNWLTLQVEYGQVIRVEIGALIDEVSDVFLWRFKG
ncbi:hypothetical protein [Flavobacterium sp.]|jgi:hypothetical protein|uniref:hypothetical protein n=1 Tax=Flavobacterium sp. TaxID=239 RepID=UPI0022CAED6C|nr:hypothetical protein [Flavobacterium sp.]MCZ8143746.1 hypothetical protein [Flavobacterium sp.]MCZ8368318.1 hypothetical protein [Flavobacterium sp.]